MSSNIKIIGLTLLGIKLESTAPEADALSTPPPEMLIVAESGRFIKQRVIDMCAIGRVLCCTSRMYQLVHSHIEEFVCGITGSDTKRCRHVDCFVRNTTKLFVFGTIKGIS